MLVGFGKWLLFLSSILIHLLVLTIAQPKFLAHYCNYDREGNYSSNSIYRTNLDSIKSNLSSNANFYNFSIGQDPDTVNVIGLCRGDIEADKCSSCLSDANIMIRQECPAQKDVIGWYQECMFRYSDRSIFHTVEIVPNAYAYNATQNASDVDGFNQVVRTLLDKVRGQAARGSSIRKYATDNMTGPNNLTVYALAQCTPDLSGVQCDECFNGVAGVLQTCCDGRVGGKVLRPSCNFRYEIDHFYADTPADAPPQTDTTLPTPTSPPGGKDNRIVLIIVVSIVTLLILLVCITLFMRRKPKKKFEMDVIADAISLQYDFDTISIATNNFSNANKLGQGGFGAVYKGRLPNGQEIAVKRLSSFSGQGEQEFKNEVSLLAKLQHRNLVRLLGFCLEGTEKLLIYEFVPNASLDHFIFDPAKRANLDWDVRYKIIGGVARGLLYLHEDSRLRIIHRDLKAGNVLLDANMNPKISDFGLAKLFAVDESQGNTARIVGTRGYMAPEYHHHGQFSVKSDVFSFGVIVLEIISGQKVNSIQNGEDIVNLLSHAWRNWREGTASKLIDPAMRDHSDSQLYIMRCINIALLCVQENLVNRPPMTQVVLMLSSTSLPLPEPLEHNQSNTSVVCSVDEATITELNPR